MAIIPGTVFSDTHGSVAQLHGVGILHIEGVYYAWGENKSAGDAFTSIAVYSSPDLETWTFREDAISAESAPMLRGQIVERPKVLRRPDGTYVMYLHVDSPDYGLAEVGYATADTPIGPFVFHGSSRPLGRESRDIGVYQENDKGYLLSEDRASGLHIYELSDDYLRPERIVATTVKMDGTHGYESPALVKEDGTFYLFGSDLTEWSHNDNKFATATNLGGPWSTWEDFAPAGSRTFESQISTVVRGPAGGWVYVGDRWTKDDLLHSPAVWLPLFIEDGRARVEWRETWAPKEH